MKEFWNVIQMVFTAVGGWLGYFLGGYDGLLYALVVFMVVDYITGVMCAVSDQVNDPMAFKVNHDRSIGEPFPERKIIHTNFCNRRLIHNCWHFF